MRLLRVTAASGESGLTRGPARRARDEVLALLAPYLCERTGRWTADYVRLRFAARFAG